jgi:hypothetical protein
MPRSTEQHPPVEMINSLVSKIEGYSTHIPAAVVNGKEKAAGQVRETWIRAEFGIQACDQRPDVGLASADAGQRRRDDIPDAFMGLSRQKPGGPYCMNEAVRHRVGEASNLQAGARGELEITAAKSLSDPTQLTKRGPSCLTARHPDAYYCPIGCRVGPQDARAAIRDGHARHRK